MVVVMDDDQTQRDSNVDIFRDTYLRYMGYANEVGESFRSLVHVNLVRFSYVLSTAYVCADAIHKGDQAYKISWRTKEERRKKTAFAVGDTFIWQGLASVAIPGFTINRICWLSELLLRNVSALPAPAKKWTVTCIGLGSIPFIIHPIDNGVDLLLESTLRKWFKIDDTLESDVVHHHRDDW